MTPPDYFVLFLFFSLGILSTVAGIFNIEWFFRTGSALFFVRHLGHQGARLFYAILGIVFMLCAVALFLNGHLTKW
ncbi:MAG: immunity 17 family protein [Tannerellaceae bacterium]|jgi:small neutral amino acid transporter SnatA (MarC family)|nr:immunity 17 family protein [Tannerellaceae bacterium]